MVQTVCGSNLCHENHENLYTTKFNTLTVLIILFLFEDICADARISWLTWDETIQTIKHERGA